MNRINETFSRGLRDALVRQVEETQRGTWRRRRRWQVGAGIGAVAVLAGGAGAAAAGFLHIPGSDIVSNMAEPAKDTYSGSTVIELGVPPESATHVSIELTCESTGTLYWEDSASMTCDEGELNASAMTSLPLEPGKQTTEIRTDDGDVQYRAKVTYVNHTLTDWAVNENGETYGGIKNDGSQPDLQAVFATNGRMGYVYTTELDEAGGSRNFTSPEEALAWQESMKGKTATVPVYEFDGITVIGEFVAGSW